VTALPERLTEISDQPRLRQIWSRSFGEGPEYPLAFFRCYPSPVGITAEVGGTPVSAMHLMEDLALIREGEERPCPYLYALATDPEHRENGLGGEVLSALTELALDKWGSAFVRPDTPELADWYSRFGYAPATFMEELELAADSLPEPRQALVHTGTDGAGYGRLRELLLADRPHIRFGGKALKYLEECCRLSGGGLFLLQYGDEAGCAAAELAGDTLLISELLCPRRFAPFLLSALADRFSARRLRVRLPVCSESRIVVPAVYGRFYGGGPTLPEGSWWGPVFD